MSVSGSIREFSIEGIPFDVAADANINRKPTNVVNDMIPTSGAGMRKITKVTPKAEGFALLVNAEEMERIKSFAEGLDNIKVRYVTADGTVKRCSGQVEVESYESEESKATITILPARDWTVFSA